MKILRTYGKPPFEVAVIHGGPGAAGEMAPVAQKLSLGRGILEPLQTKSTIKDQISELKTILERNADLPVTLIGFSWGAWLSFLFAAKNPTFVKKLILIGSGPFEEKYAREIEKTRLNRLTVKERNEIESLFNIVENPNAKNKSLEFARIGELFSKTDAYDPIERKSEKVVIRFDIFQNVWKEAAELRRSGKLMEFVKHIQCPVVAIHGDYDPHPTQGVMEPLSKTLKDFRFFLLKDCGHKPWIERKAKDGFYTLLKRELTGEKHN
jgi:pimeloyl-ACP methyl ester carboxylesterase